MNQYESADPYAKRVHPSFSEIIEERIEATRELWRKIEELPAFAESGANYAAGIDNGCKTQINIVDEYGTRLLTIRTGTVEGVFTIEHKSGVVVETIDNIPFHVEAFTRLHELEFFATDAKIAGNPPLNRAAAIVHMGDCFDLEVEGVYIRSLSGGKFSVFSERLFTGLSRQAVMELIRGMK